MKAIKILILALVLSATCVSADPILYDVDTDPSAWAAATAGMTSSVAWDFDIDADYGGIVGFTGPLTAAGNGPVSAGVLGADVVLNSVAGGANNLVAIGASAGFGNTSNFVGANLFADGIIALTFGPAGVDAIDFIAADLLGATTVDLYATDVLGNVTAFLGINTSVLGHAWGLLSDGNAIASISLEGESGEGFVGLSNTYAVTAAPEPGTLALLGIGLFGMGLSRRRKA